MLCRHLRDLLRDAERDDLMFHEHNKIIADFSRQRLTKKTLEVGRDFGGPLLHLLVAGCVCKPQDAVILPTRCQLITKCLGLHACAAAVESGGQGKAQTED